MLSVLFGERVRVVGEDDEGVDQEVEDLVKPVQLSEGERGEAADTELQQPVQRDGENQEQGGGEQAGGALSLVIILNPYKVNITTGTILEAIRKK